MEYCLTWKESLQCGSQTYHVCHIIWLLYCYYYLGKVMTYNDKLWKSADCLFGYIGSIKIYITDQYNYLGVIFDNKMSFKNHIKMIAEKADKCLWALIWKNREWKSFQPRLFLCLFDHLISPILSYGCEIWGNKEWEEIEKFPGEGLMIFSDGGVPL